MAEMTLCHPVVVTLWTAALWLICLSLCAHSIWSTQCTETDTAATAGDASALKWVIRCRSDMSNKSLSLHACTASLYLCASKCVTHRVQQKAHYGNYNASIYPHHNPRICGGDSEAWPSETAQSGRHTLRAPAAAAG